MLCRRWQREVIIRPPDPGRGGNAFQPEGQAVAACVQPLRGARQFSPISTAPTTTTKIVI